MQDFEMAVQKGGPISLPLFGFLVFVALNNFNEGYLENITIIKNENRSLKD